MSTVKISQLTELTSAATDDLLLITDSDANSSKKITKANLLSGYLTSYTETDPVVGAVTGIVKADGAGNISAAVAGTDYLSSYTETDPVVGAITGLVKADGAGNISAAVAGTDYLASYTETDPVVGAITGIVKADGAGNISAAVEGTDYISSYTVTEGDVTAHEAALSITEGQISDLGGDIVLDSDIGVTVQAYDANLVTYATNGNTAYGWGDHSTEGYLTSYTETDPVVGAVTGIVKADGAGSISAASAGTDYLAPAAIGTTVQAYDADTAKTDTTQNFTAPQRSADTVDNDGSFDLSAAQNFTCTPTGSITLTFTNIPDGQSGFILLVNTTPQTVSLHANTKGDANLATTLSTAGTYLVSYYANGTNVYLTTSGAIA